MKSPELISVTKHQYVSMGELGLAATLVCSGFQIIGRACVEGMHYFVFKDSPRIKEALTNFGTENEAPVQGSTFYEVVENLRIEAEDESL